jgi:hypothetical protein
MLIKYSSRDESLYICAPTVPATGRLGANHQFSPCTVCGPQATARHAAPFEFAEAAEQACAAKEVRDGRAARPSQLIRVIAPRAELR